MKSKRSFKIKNNKILARLRKIIFMFEYFFAKTFFKSNWIS